MQLVPSFFASASPSGARRPAITIFAPSSTKISAVVDPMPLVAPAFGGFRTGVLTAIAGGLLGIAVSFDGPPPDAARPVLLLIYVVVCGLIIWGTSHYRSIASHYRELSRKLTEEEAYRKLVVEELQHRLKNKLSTIHAV